MNRISLVGRLTRDPMVFDTGNPYTKTVKYTLTVQSDRKDRESDTYHTDFLPVTCWGNRALFAEKYLHQGMRIAVSGNLRSSRYAAADGQMKYDLSVIAERQEFADGKVSDDNKIPDDNTVSDTKKKKRPA